MSIWPLRGAPKIPEAYLDSVQNADAQFAYYLSEKERTAYIAKWMTARLASCPPMTARLATDVAVHFTDQEYAFYSQLSIENSYMDKVERTDEHYLDEGCVCDACMKRRKEVAEKIIAAPHHPINSSYRIHHREAVKKHMVQRVTNSMATNAGSIGIRLRKSARNRRKSRSRSYSVRMKLF